MKKIRLITLLLSMILLSACQSDNDSPEDNDPTLGGTWKLTAVYGGIAGTHDTYPAGMISWEFNTTSQTVTVLNTNTDDMKQDLLDSGTYNYSFSPNTVTPDTCDEVLLIGGVSYGCYDIGSEMLTLNQVETDGFMVTLER
jgi:hypothetical protein